MPRPGASYRRSAWPRCGEIFFADKKSLGQRKFELEQQPEFPENLRWRRGGVLFLTLHIVGSNNNLGRTPEGDAEYRSAHGRPMPPGCAKRSSLRGARTPPPWRSSPRPTRASSAAFRAGG